MKGLYSTQRPARADALRLVADRKPFMGLKEAWSRRSKPPVRMALCVQQCRSFNHRWTA